MSPRTTARPDAVFRGLFSLIFIVAGVAHLVNPTKIVHKLLAAPLHGLATWMAPPVVLVTLAGVALVIGGTMLLLGFRTKIAAIGLIAVLVPITLTVQVGSVSTIGPLLKNVALLGGLIHFFYAGAGPLSLDAVCDRRRGCDTSPEGPRPGRALGLGGLAAGALALVLGVVVSLSCAARTEAKKGVACDLPPRAAHAVVDPAPGAAPNGTVARVPRPSGVAFLVRTLPTLKASLMTSTQMLGGKGVATKHAEVVVCGKVVPQLVMGSDLEPALEQASKHGVKVVACGLSLSHAKIDPRSLSTFVSVVPNGLVEMIRLEAAGWKTVSL